MIRKTPIKRKTKPRQRGASTLRWQAWRTESRAEVARRANGRCEFCGEFTVLDWAHMFGRRNIVREPYASSPQFTVMLCRTCHRVMDTEDGDLRRLLRLGALALFAITFNPGLALAEGREHEPTVAVAREYERSIQAAMSDDEFKELAIRKAREMW